MSNPGQGAMLGNGKRAALFRRPHGRTSHAVHSLSRMLHTAALRPQPRLLVSLPARGLIALIWLYRHSLSPVLPVVCGPGCGCRFHPTCAVYATDAISAHGAVRGSWLAVVRLLKCHPWHPGGFDPVPPSPRRSPACKTVLRGSPTEA